MKRFVREPTWAKFKKEVSEEADLHDGLCAKNDIPCIQIYPKSRGRFCLRWDFNTYNSESWDRAIRLHRRQAATRILYKAFCENTSSKRAIFEGHLLSGHIKGLTEDEAKNNASILFRIIDRFVHGGTSGVKVQI